MSARRFLTLALLPLLAGCSMTTMVANNMTGTMDNMKKAFFAESSTKHAQSAGPAMLMMLDGFIQAAPENLELLQRGAEMNCAFAQTFLDDTDREYAKVLYKKGLKFAMKAIEVDQPKVFAAIQKADEAELEKLLAETPDDFAPISFWAGICWGGQINAAMEADLATGLPMVEKLIARSEASQPDYFFYAAYIYHAMFYASRSSMLGGDLEKGREYFEKAIQASGGNFLLWRIMFARAYAVNKQDPELFVKLLNEVLEAPSDDPSDRVLANQAAREKASRMIENLQDFFPSYQPASAQPLEEEPLEDLDLN